MGECPCELDKCVDTICMVEGMCARFDEHDDIEETIDITSINNTTKQYILRK